MTHVLGLVLEDGVVTNGFWSSSESLAVCAEQRKEPRCGLEPQKVSLPDFVSWVLPGLAFACWPLVVLKGKFFLGRKKLYKLEEYSPNTFLKCDLSV